jgi:hypothetical protein
MLTVAVVVAGDKREAAGLGRLLGEGRTADVMRVLVE